MKAVNNDDLIRAVFTATDEAKTKALAVLEGRDKPNIDTGPLLLSMGDAAQLLHVSRATLWRTIKSGRLPKVELYPGSFRLRRSDILDLINSRPLSRSLPNNQQPATGNRLRKEAQHG